MISQPASQLFVIDLDRTLINTPLIIELIEQTCEQIGIKHDHEKVKELALEKRGKTFEPLSFVGSHGHKVLETFEKVFLDLCSKNEIVYKDAHRLLKRLELANVPSIILTFGPERWQRLKLIASGFQDKPYIITNEQDKSLVVASWMAENGFKPPINAFGSYKKVVLVDDKPEAFHTMTAGMDGYLILRNKTHDFEQKNQIKLIRSLDELEL